MTSNKTFPKQKKPQLYNDAPCAITSVDWVEQLVCRWPSAPKVAGRDPSPCRWFFMMQKIDSGHERPCRMIIRHVKNHLKCPFGSVAKLL
ncbi:hypothetical protein TNCV_451391 [Trichonephila clavipes]|nr:hypothetical protein TNCV_451391 [Trichonephila clavipes]